MKFWLFFLIFVFSIGFVSAQSLPISPYYVKERSLTYDVIENIGELENYTLNNINYFYNDGWNITINMTGDEPEQNLTIYKKEKSGNKTKIGKTKKERNPKDTKINLKIYGSQLIHIGNQSLVINFTENNTLANNSIKDVFIYNLSTDTTSYTTWYNDSSTSWFQKANDTRVNGYLALDGDDDDGGIIVDDSNDFNASSGVNKTYMFWFWTRAEDNQNDWFFDYGHGIGGLFFANNWVNKDFDLYVGGVEVFNTDNSLWDEETWYHVALTKKGSFWQMYLNGVSVPSGSGIGTTSGTFKGDDFVIGYAFNAADVGGRIDDFYIYNQSLTATEIGEVYSRGLQHLESNITEDLMAHWTMDSNAYDSSGRDHHGTVQNDAYIEAKSSQTNFPLNGRLVCSYTGLDIIDDLTNTVWARNFSMNNCDQVFALEGDIVVDDGTNFLNYSFKEDEYSKTLTRADKIFVSQSQYAWYNGSGVCRDKTKIDYAYTCTDHIVMNEPNDLVVGNYIAVNDGTNTHIYNDDLSLRTSNSDGNVTALAIGTNGQTLYSGITGSRIEERDMESNVIIRSWNLFPSNLFTTLAYGSLLAGTENGGAFVLNINQQTQDIPQCFNFTIYEREDTHIKINWSTPTDGSLSSYCTNCATQYGNIFQHYGNGTTITISSQNVYYNVTGMNEGYARGVMISDSSMEITEAGLYEYDYSISFSGGANDVYDVAVGINGIPTNDSHSHRKLGAGGDVGNTGGTGTDTFEEGDIITLLIENHDAAADAEIDTATLRIKKISQLNSGNITIQYSLDNATWNNFKYVLTDKGYASTPLLTNNTNYYIRGRNTSCRWTYINTTTLSHTGGGGTEMADLAIMLFVLVATGTLFMLPFIKRKFVQSEITNLIMKRACWTIAIYLMMLNASIAATIAANAGLNLTQEMFRYMWLFGIAGYLMMGFMVLRTIFDVKDLWRENLERI